MFVHDYLLLTQCLFMFIYWLLSVCSVLFTGYSVFVQGYILFTQCLFKVVYFLLSVCSWLFIVHSVLIHGNLLFTWCLFIIKVLGHLLCNLQVTDSNSVLHQINEVNMGSDCFWLSFWQ